MPISWKCPPNKNKGREKPQISPNFASNRNILNTVTIVMWKENRQELIRRWDSESELFTTISHMYFKIPKKETISFSKLDDS